MKISYIYLLLTLNYVTTVVIYYKKCYEEFSICLITNIDDPSAESRFRLSRASADDWCKRKSSSLAFITNANVQSAIEAFIKDSSAKLDSDVITNGYRYGFPFNNWEWIGRRSANYPFSESSDYRYGYLQVSAGRNATIYGSIPTTARNFICSYLSRNSNCPDDHHQLGSSCYKIHNNEAANWFDARNLCLQEGYDLATFADIDLSSNSGWLSKGEYWVGLRSEIWHWLLDQSDVGIKYSNFDKYRPYATGEYCLCLAANTGKWEDCNCYQKHRYICIRDSPRLIIWISLAILIILIVVVVAWIVVKKHRKRNRNLLGGGSAKSRTHQHSSSLDAYATLNPETSTENRTYDQLQLYETIGENETE